MILTLTNDQKAALDSSPGSFRLLDDRSNTEYALIRIDPWQAAQLQACESAGWADPAMDDYDRYDEQLLQKRNQS